MLSILLPAARRSTPEEAQSCWGDLRVALASIAAYAPDVDVVVGWSGRERPRDLPPNPRMRLIEQAPGITTGSEAWNWCSTQTDAEDLLILGDDCVLHPDTVGQLLADRDFIHREAPDLEVGFLGARSNYVKGPQNLRSPNGDTVINGIQFDSEGRIFQADMVVPVAALVRHDVFDLTDGFPPTNWFADDLMCWDLKRMGYSHFVSRAYVHHVGQRGTGQGKTSEQLLEEGLDWLRRNRIDFLHHLQGTSA
ncbi:glycosyltransferase family 2 protein [Kineococcus gynurae]|uniref:Glycosyltransferase family 2 protein n=1 Tax=Kineococcus gynurae TaxID=452979 RepID=A0ABV5LXJ5_9ACTN